MRLGKGKRKLLRGLIFAFGALLMVWVTLPLWFPWVLRPVARMYGAQFSRYERDGYKRFTLQQVTFTNRTARFHADRMDCLVPSIWLWRALAHPEGWTPNETFVRMNGWQYEAIPAGKRGGSSTYTNAVRVTRTFQTVAKWLPSAVLTNGTVVVEKTVVVLSAATWGDRHLWAQVGLPLWAQTGIVNADLQPSKPYELRIHSDSLRLESAVQISADSAAIKLQSSSQWWSNKIELLAEFGRAGALPEKATLEVRAFQFPADLAWLEGYQNIRGSLNGNWETGKFVVDVKAGAVPLTTETNLPPIQLDLRARGDTNAAVIESAVISSPLLRAQLSKEPTIYFRGPLLREPVALRLAMDLTNQPWVPAQGAINGQAEFSPGRGRFPRATFQLSGTGVSAEKISSRTLTIRGSLDWPSVEVTSAECGFEDGSTAIVSGKMDFKERALADGSLQFSGPLARKFMPQGYGYGSLSLTGSFSGPITQVVHQVHLEAADVICPDLQPLQVQADWSGRVFDVDSAEMKVSAGKSALLVDFSGQLKVGSADRKTVERSPSPQPSPPGRGSTVLSPSPNARFVEGGTVKLMKLILTKNGGEALVLEGPAQVAVSRGSGSNNWSGRLDSFHWLGRAGDIQARGKVDWPGNGNFQVAMQGVSSDLLSDFVRTNPAQIQIQKIAASAEWSNGPVRFEADLSAREVFPQTPPLTIEMKVTADRNGIVLSNLAVLSQTSTVAVAQGALPATINPGAGTNTLDFDLDKPLQLSARTEPHAVLWNQLAQWTGVVLGDPKLDLNISGTWRSPKGAVHLNARQIQLKKAQRRLPTLNDLALELQLDRQEARLSQCQLRLQGQPVSLTGQMPLGEAFWAGLKRKQLPDWQKASARLRIDNAQLAAFADFAPAFVAPQGKVDVDLSLSPGGKVAGGLVLSGARTQPLSGIGPVRDIEAKLNFAERTLRLENAKATIGGGVITLAGQGDLRGEEWLKGELPPFAFTLRGTNIPLSRQLESIIRSDLDIAITKTNAAPPLISGAARLRDSYFLSDLADLVPGKIETPSRRPPYFSIEDPFLADWRLGVKVTGGRFLTVRSSLFNGQVSANLVVQGTLKEPLALGDIKMDSGFVRFPFASLQVNQGFVTLTSQDPYRPQLSVTAGSKQYGYDIKMELTGPADAPVIQFTSTPPLNSEQILLMVTAGQLPKGEFTLTPQQRAQTVGLFLGRDLLSKLGVGDQAAQRLTFHSGEELTEHGKPTYGVEYKLTGRWSLEGEYDRFGEYNAGIKWRVYSK